MNSGPLKERVGKLAEGLREGGEGEALTSSLVRQAVKLVVEQLLEAEVSEVLGRQLHARRPPEPPADRSSTADPAGKAPSSLIYSIKVDPKAMNVSMRGTLPGQTRGSIKGFAGFGLTEKVEIGMGGSDKVPEFHYNVPIDQDQFKDAKAPVLNDKYCAIFLGSILLAPRIEGGEFEDIQGELDLPKDWKIATGRGLDAITWKRANLQDLADTLVGAGDSATGLPNLTGLRCRRRRRAPPGRPRPARFTLSLSRPPSRSGSRRPVTRPVPGREYRCQTSAMAVPSLCSSRVSRVRIGKPDRRAERRHCRAAGPDRTGCRRDRGGAGHRPGHRPGPGRDGGPRGGRRTDA